MGRGADRPEIGLDLPTIRSQLQFLPETAEKSGFVPGQKLVDSASGPARIAA